MKRLVILSLFSLIACQDDTPSAGTNELLTPAQPEQSCALDLFSPLIGTMPDTLDTAKLPGPVRVIQPGMMVTQDYRPDRTNIEIGKDGRIAHVWCG